MKHLDKKRLLECKTQLKDFIDKIRQEVGIKEY